MVDDLAVAGLSENYWIILVAGGHAAGKTCLSQNLEAALLSVGQTQDLPITVHRIAMSAYEETEGSNSYTPSRFNFDRIWADINSTKFWKQLCSDSDEKGEPQGGSPDNATEKATKNPVVAIIEGEYALYDKRLRDRAIMKVFIDVDADTRLSRRIIRDLGPDQSHLGTILDEYLNHLRPEMTNYILPTRQYADAILHNSGPGSTDSGVKLIATGSYDRIRQELLLDPDQQPSASLLSESHHVEPSFRVRRESFVEQRERFYGLN